MQQYPFPRLVSSERIFSFQLSGLCLVTRHATCFAIINLASPIAALHYGKMPGSGERCLMSHNDRLKVDQKEDNVLYSRTRLKWSRWQWIRVTTSKHYINLASRTDQLLFLGSQDFGGRFDHWVPPVLFFCVCVCEVEICTHQFHFLGRDQSTVAQRAETTVAESSLMSCVWACFPNRFPYYAWTA